MARLRARALAHIVVRPFLAVVPLLLTVLFAWLVMDDRLSFGGSEKEIVLAVPLAIWSLAYLGCHVVLWWRRAMVARSVAISSVLATGVVAVAWLALFGARWLR